MEKLTRNSNALMRDGSVMADSDLVDFFSGSTDSAINFSGFTHPYSPPPLYKEKVGDSTSVELTLPSLHLKNK